MSNLKLDHPLSDDEIDKLLNDDVNIVTYNVFKNMTDINDVFKKSDNVILLYQWDDGGHWVSIIKHDDNLIEYFGSFGIFPDSQLDWSPQMLNPKYGQEHKYLLNLIIKWLESNPLNKFEYNNHDYQSKYGTNTCGRWAVYRIWNKDIPLDQFLEQTKNLHDADIIKLTEKH
jgi:hypothetical protein